MSGSITPGTSDIFGAFSATLPIFVIVGITSLIVAYIVRCRQKRQDHTNQNFKHMASSRKRIAREENNALQ